MAQIQFNTNDFAPLTDFMVLPAGWAIFHIASDEIKPNPNDPSKGQLVMKAVVHQGRFKGQEVRIGLNCIHPDVDTQKRAMRELSTIVQAVGYTGQVADTSVIFGHPFMARIEYDAPNKPDGLPFMRLKGYTACPKDAASCPAPMIDDMPDYVHGVTPIPEMKGSAAGTPSGGFGQPSGGFAAQAAQHQDGFGQPAGNGFQAQQQQTAPANNAPVNNAAAGTAPAGGFGGPAVQQNAAAGNATTPQNNTPVNNGGFAPAGDAAKTQQQGGWATQDPNAAAGGFAQSNGGAATPVNTAESSQAPWMQNGQ